MAGTMSDLRKGADGVRNWGRWGGADELGTLNFIAADKIARAATVAKQGKVFALRMTGAVGSPVSAIAIK